MCSMTSIGCLFHIFIHLACFWQEIFIRSCLPCESSLSPFCISVLSDCPLSLCDLSCDAECALYAVEMCAMLSHLNQVLKQQCKIIRHLWIIVHFLKLLCSLLTLPTLNIVSGVGQTVSILDLLHCMCSRYLNFVYNVIHVCYPFQRSAQRYLQLGHSISCRLCALCTLSSFECWY